MQTVEEQLYEIGTKVLQQAHSQLYLSMRYLEGAFSAFSYEMRQETDPFGTDGAVIYFQGRLLTIGDQSAAVRLGEKEQVEKPWIFYQEGEKVIEHGPNPYLALYYVKTENRKEMDLLTEEFYEEMHILDPNGQEVAYHNQIPDYAPAEK